MKKSTSKLSRRRLLKASAGVAVAGAFVEAYPAAEAAAEAAAAAQGAGKPSVYEALGLRHVINATGTVTNLGGSVMPPEVVAAWAEASRNFVNLLELQDKVGERIAKLIGVEAATVTTGAAGALQLAAAAAVTGADRKLIQRLPSLPANAKSEIILQKTHHSCYDNQLTSVGATLIDVETPADVQKAVSARTALMFYMNKAEPDGQITAKEWVNLARRHKVPTLLDAAADVPPLERLAGYSRLGFDLVAFSGGKAMRGPNDTGLLLGRRPLIEAAKLNANPHCGTLGRALKVGKEDMIALLAAVERFVKLDHKAEWQEFERRIGVIEKAVAGLPTLQTERLVPAIANHVPHLVISWDEKRRKLTRDQVTRSLAQGNPPIQIGRVSGTGDRGILISVLTLQAGEEKALAERLRAIFS